MLDKTKSLPATPSADSFLKEIRFHLKEVEDAGAVAKDHAILCGRALALAKESVKAEKGIWKDWLAVNDIPKSSAELYMDLAEHEAEIKDCKSINEARKKVTAIREPEREAKRIADGKPPKTSNAVRRGKSSKTQSEGETQPEETLSNLAPDEVFKKLRAAWDKQHLAELANLLATYLKEQKALANA